jgi:tRNA threonylcarbamoyladenosine modification (KEOPS) complex  Pcc1 subunit
MITAVISVTDALVHKVFAAEERILSNNRGSYTVKLQGKKTIIEVSAADATALRAVLNSISKVLIVYEKASKVIEDG